MNQRQKELDVKLKKFSLTLKPTDDRLKEGNLNAQKIFNFLQQNSDYGIDRPYIGGSVGKKTAAQKNPDLDLVVFVNLKENEEPPFHDVMVNFDALLTKFENLTIGPPKSENSRQLVYNDFEIDLLPAANLVNNCAEQPSKKKLAALQAYHTLQKIEQDPPNNYYKYGSCLAETQLDFVRQQTPFVHDFIRICKYWIKRQVQIKEFGGRSTLMELIAIKIGSAQETKTKSRNILDAFKTFLKTLVDFHTLEIEFDFDPLEPIRDETPWKPHVDESMRSRPFVMEPANPFNNLARWMAIDLIGQISEAAENTLDRLAYFDDDQPIEKLFEPILISMGNSHGLQLASSVEDEPPNWAAYQHQRGSAVQQRPPNEAGANEMSGWMVAGGLVLVGLAAIGTYSALKDRSSKKK